MAGGSVWWVVCMVGVCLVGGMHGGACVVGVFVAEGAACHASPCEQNE